VFVVQLTYDSEIKRPLIHLAQQQFRRMAPNPAEETTGQPTHYMRFADTVTFWRVPDQALGVNSKFEKWPANFTAGDNAVSDFIEKDDLIIVETTRRLLKQLGRGKSALEYAAEYNGLMFDAIQEDATDPDLSLMPRGISDGTNEGWPVGDYWADPFVR
jgi:hypothetical protein